MKALPAWFKRLAMESLGIFVMLVGVALLTTGILGFGMAAVIIGLAFMVAGVSGKRSNTAG